MKCNCCGSDRHYIHEINQHHFTNCAQCGLMFTDRPTKDRIIDHYREVDPHETVAAAKRPFFKAALVHLSTQTRDPDRSILDVGCGFGYFLEDAAKTGWVPFGVEILEDAVTVARDRFGKKQIFHGSLQSARYPSNTFHAVTAWDVLVVVDDPFREVRECYRILKPGGTIGIRVRNVLFEKAVYTVFRTIQPVAGKMGIRHPYVFHTYCFTPISLKYLFHRAGFERVSIENSPLTKGDPYAYTPFRWLTTSAKVMVETLTSRLISLSNGRWVLGPSLLVWATKPRSRG